MTRVMIECIGVDGQFHQCEPHKDVALCGMPVKRKVVNESDCGVFTCCECDYSEDEE